MTRTLSPFPVTRPLRINTFLVKSYFAFFVVFFSITLGTGQLGYGEDVVNSYRGAELWWLSEKPTELLGWFLSTTHYSLFDVDIFLGSILAAFVLSYGLIKLSLSIFQDSTRTPFYLVATITFMHFSHPILFGALNVLRQGFSIGFFYIAISSLLKQRGRTAAFYSLLAIMSHNSIIALIIPLYATFYAKAYLRVFIVFVGALLLHYAVAQDLKSSQATNIDQKSLYLLIMGIYAAIYVFARKEPRSSIGYRRELLATSMLLAIPLILILFNRESAFARMSMAWFLPAFMIGVYVARIPLNVKNAFLVMFTLLLAFITVFSVAIQGYSENI